MGWASLSASCWMDGMVAMSFLGQVDESDVLHNSPESSVLDVSSMAKAGIVGGKTYQCLWPFSRIEKRVAQQRSTNRTWSSRS